MNILDLCPTVATAIKEQNDDALLIGNKWSGMKVASISVVCAIAGGSCGYALTYAFNILLAGDSNFSSPAPIVMGSVVGFLSAITVAYCISKKTKDTAIKHSQEELIKIPIKDTLIQEDV